MAIKNDTRRVLTEVYGTAANDLDHMGFSLHDTHRLKALLARMAVNAQEQLDKLEDSKS